MSQSLDHPNKSCVCFVSSHFAPDGVAAAMPATCKSVIKSVDVACDIP